MKKLMPAILIFALLFSACGEKHTDSTMPDLFWYDYLGHQYSVMFEYPTNWDISKDAVPIRFTAPPDYTVRLFGNQHILVDILSLFPDYDSLPDEAAELADPFSDITGATLEIKEYEGHDIAIIKHKNDSTYSYMYLTDTEVGAICVGIDWLKKDNNPYEKVIMNMLTSFTITQIK